MLDLAIRLVNDGIDIVLDKWELKAGHDSYAFMESMVTDPTVTKVIMICDQAYVTKANARAGGVGTEGQIISPELYGKVAQNKYAALVTEVDDRGHRHLPMFYKGRIYFDFVSADAFEVQYEALLRWLADKPLFVKPSVGRLPEKILTPVVAIKIDVPPKAAVVSQATKPKPEKRAPDEAIGRDAAELAVKEANLARTQGKANRAFRIALAGWVMARENGATIPPQLTTYLGNWCLEGSHCFTIKTASSNDKITAFSPDGKYILIATADINALQLIDAKSGALIGDPMIHSDAISCAQFSSNGELIATGSVNGEVRLWNVVTQELFCNVMQHGDNTVQFLSFSIDRRRLLTCDKNCAIQWETQLGEKIVREMILGDAKITNAEYSSDGYLILITGNSGFINIFDSVSGESIGFNRKRMNFYKIFGRFYLRNWIIYSGDCIMNYNLRDKTEIVVTGHGVFELFDISKNYKLIATFNNNQVIIFDLTINKIICIFNHGLISSIKFSPNSNFILLGSENTTSLCRADRGALLRTPMQHYDAVRAASFSPDGNAVLTVCANGNASVWDISSTYLEGDALIEHICRHHLIDDQEFTDAELRASMIPDLPRNPVAACLAWLEANR